MFADFYKFINDLAAAINGEYKAIKFYTELAAIAPCKEAREFIIYARDDEKKHYQMFCRLYLELTGRHPVVAEPHIQMPDFCTGVMESVNDELEAADMYRGMLLSTTNIAIRDIMFEAMTDELEHATRFTFVYSMADCHVDECEVD
ncbi:ferritin family protein [Phosphitispora sp. TUW77]|uniref:ferritin family protein n=1 Tax=Phosphitispora sp. TUW77 TaxID=3152361 RepID=UPI003AB8A504